MSDINQESTQPAATASKKRTFTGRRLAMAGIVAVGLTAVGAGVVYSQSPWGGWGHGPGYGYGHGQGYGPGPGYGPGYGGGYGGGPGYGYGPHGHPGMMPRGWMFGFGPERMIDFALSNVGATSEQKQKIITIARGAFDELSPLRLRRDAAREKLAGLLKAETVDKAAIERLRAEEFAAFEAGSKRAAQALSDAAEVLTTSQRQQLVERIESRRRYWRG